MFRADGSDHINKILVVRFPNESRLQGIVELQDKRFAVDDFQDVDQIRSVESNLDIVSLDGGLHCLFRLADYRIIGIDSEERAIKPTRETADRKEAVESVTRFENSEGIARRYSGYLPSISRVVI